jgi:hypothetical protein
VLYLLFPVRFHSVSLFTDSQLLQETKGRTLEEIGSLFGDKNVVSHWYGITEEERDEITKNALKLTDSGHSLKD